MEAFVPTQQTKDFVMSPNFILKQKDLCQGAKTLFIALCSFARNKNFCYPSLRTLAIEISASVNSIKSWLAQLTRFGFIKTEKTNRGNLFYLFCPSSTSCASAPTSHDRPAKFGSSTPLRTPATSSSPVSNSDTSVSNLDTAGLSKFDTKENTIKKTINTPIRISQVHKLGQSKQTSSETKGIESRGEASFDDFWNAYPRQENKQKAKLAFDKIQKHRKLPSLHIFKNALAIFRKSPQWERESGRYIPLLHNFFYDLRWEDIPPQELMNVEKVKETLQEKVHIESVEQSRKRLQEERLTRSQAKQSQEKLERAWKAFSNQFKADNSLNQHLAKFVFISHYSQGNPLQVFQKQDTTIHEYLLQNKLISNKAM